MDNQILCKLVREGKSTREIAKITEKSQTAVRYWLKKYCLRTKPSIPRSWTDADMCAALKICGTIADALRLLGLSKHSANYVAARKCATAAGLDLSHMVGRRAGTGGPRKRPLLELMVQNSTYSRASLKRRLLMEDKLEAKCSICGLGDVWEGTQIIHVLDHVNGISNDHRFENLRMLCPNCNSQQPTFAGRNRKRKYLT